MLRVAAEVGEPRHVLDEDENAALLGLGDEVRDDLRAGKLLLSGSSPLRGCPREHRALARQVVARVVRPDLQRLGVLKRNVAGSNGAPEEAEVAFDELSAGPVASHDQEIFQGSQRSMRTRPAISPRCSRRRRRSGLSLMARNLSCRGWGGLVARRMTGRQSRSQFSRTPNWAYVRSWTWFDGGNAGIACWPGRSRVERITPPEGGPCTSRKRS